MQDHNPPRASCMRLAPISLILLAAVACGDDGAGGMELFSTAETPSAAERRAARDIDCRRREAGAWCGVEGQHCVGGQCVDNTCGDGFVAGDEVCDDGNRAVGDGCDSSCQLEPQREADEEDPPEGEEPEEEDEPDEGGQDAGTDEEPDPCAELDDGTSCGEARFCIDGTCNDNRCGDGFVAGDEECDDGNVIEVDDCTDQCRQARCGDGIVSLTEECDGGEGCSSECLKESSCGNGVVDLGEECDDGNTSPNDGCDGACKIAGPCRDCVLAADPCLPYPDPGAEMVERCWGDTDLAGAGPATGVPRGHLCAVLYQCMQDNHCDSNGTLDDCYCGVGVDPTLCTAVGPSGPCKDEVAAAAEEPEPDTMAGIIRIQERFFLPMYALGRVAQLTRCEGVPNQSACEPACR